MKEIGANRSSGASLAAVLFAIAITAGYGAYTKRKDSDRTPRLHNPSYEFELRLLESGSGIAPVPTAPPAAAWLKFELLAGGKPVYHRPVQFRKRAWDGAGKPLVTEHRWHDGYFYAFVRSGFRESRGPVKLQINYRENPVIQMTLDPLPKPRRALQPVATKPKCRGLRAEVVRMPRESTIHLGVTVDAPLGPDEALVVERLGSTYLSREPYGMTWFAKAGPKGTPRVIPLALGYPKDADAVSLRIRRLRAVRRHHEMEFGIRYNGQSDNSYLYTLRPVQSEIAGGIMLALGRFDRSVAVSKTGTQPFRIYLSARSVVARSNTRLISPRSIHGAPVVLGNRIYSAEDVAEVSAVSAMPVDARPTVVDETIPIRIAVDAWTYEPVEEETIVVPYDYRRLRMVPKGVQPPLIYFNF